MFCPRSPSIRIDDSYCEDTRSTCVMPTILLAHLLGHKVKSLFPEMSSYLFNIKEIKHSEKT